MYRDLRRGVSIPALFAVSIAATILFSVPVLSAWAAFSLPIPEQDFTYNSVNDDLSGLISLTSGHPTQFLLDDDERDEGDDERDDDHKHKDKDGRKSDDKNEKDGDHKDKEHDRPPKSHHKSGHGDAPLAQDQTVITNEDTAVEIKLRASSNKQGALSFAILDEPAHGQVRELNSSNGTVIYEPSENFFGEDRFSYRVTDSDGDSHSATVRILVAGVNDVPTAEGSELVTREGRSVSFALKASDVDGDELTYIIMSDPAHGKQTGIPPNLSYAPTNHFHGSDAITFKVMDGKAESAPATIKITIRADRDNDSKDNDRWWESTPKSSQTGGSTIPSTSVPTPALPESSPDVPSIIPLDLPAADEGAIGGIVDTAALVVTKDILSPRLIFPASSIEAIAQSAAGAIVTYTVKATDETDGEVAASCSPSSGTKFPVGRFNVVCYATDAAGNSALSSFVVIVHEATLGESAPAFLLPLLIASVLGAGGYVGFRIFRRQSLMK